MAQYKVPQDVEADDKLLGPFSFRQFVYLLIAGGGIALAVGLFQIFPLLAIIPVPIVLLMLVLALPIKKDQPMETYLVALVTYYLKPKNRLWNPGQRESTIRITAPKIVEEKRTRDLSEEEATHRLSFLANIVDTEGYAIKGAASNPMRDDLIAEANATNDMFETPHFDDLENVIMKDEDERFGEVVKEMHNTIDEVKQEEQGVGGRSAADESMPDYKRDEFLSESPVVVKPVPKAEVRQNLVEKPVENFTTDTDKNLSQTPVKPSIIDLANNTDYSVATIAKEANRINGKDDGEVFISLH